jgi:magnesium transporter
MDAEKNISNNPTLDELSEVLDSGAIIKARNLLNALYPSEIADVIESSPRNRRDLLWSLVSNDNKGETLAELTEEVRSNLLDELIDEGGPEGLAVIAKNLVTKTVKSLDKQNQDRLSKVLSFPDDTAGGLMNIDTINVRSNVTVEVLLKYLRSLEKLPEQTDIVFVTDIMNKYFGFVSIQDLLVTNTGTLTS